MTAFPTSGIPLDASPISRGGESIVQPVAGVDQPRRLPHAYVTGLDAGVGGARLLRITPPAPEPKIRGGLGGPTKETPMKAYAVLLTFGLAVFALSIRFAFLIAELAGRSWS